VHEDGHRDFCIKAPAKIEQAISVMTPRKTCEELGEEANDLGYRILEQYANEEKAYDARTNFGETQGAIFP
jgi:predicted secreted Zn-dependent protease